ncbi:sodium:solute symporter family protein [Heliobacterium gestii]|uniref:Sodium:solute symporter family protein n=1 Tax=Heliomicrobium gestii TaxID=2699 RepID=A0A845LBF4_HELGE|nr:sodium:solute symporter family protein [Heliomicrobium gestii]MBM7866310.1 SSS family solute:Na+ symporter [Heliomicrobium gestii]MZP42901.1 sodium:solute symporter family protein [Heliomicrobium gestii]
MELSSIQLFSLTATLLVVVALGISSARNVKSADDFSIGSHSSGAALVSGTIVGTVIGGAATMGTAQLAFTAGLSAWWFTLGSGIGLIIMSLFYSSPLRRSGMQTISQYLVQHYGKAAGPIISVAASLGIFFSIVASMLSSIHLLSSVFAVGEGTSALITIAIVIAYVFFGGINGAGLSGLFKVSLLYLTLLVAGVMAYHAMGGIEGMKTAFPAGSWFHLFGGGVWADMGNALALIVGIISTQTYVQAIYSARDTRSAATGSFVAALITIPVGLPSIIIGMYMHANYPDMAPINALPMYALHYLPEWLGGMAIAALLLSSIGSVAGLSLGIGTMISRDIIGELFQCHGPKKLLWLNRISILVITIGAALFVFSNSQSLVLKWNFLSMAMRGVGIFVPLTIAIFYPGILPKNAGVCSMIAGVAASLLGDLLCPENNMPLFWGLTASLVVALLGITMNKRDKWGPLRIRFEEKH